MAFRVSQHHCAPYWCTLESSQRASHVDRRNMFSSLNLGRVTIHSAPSSVNSMLEALGEAAVHYLYHVFTGGKSNLRSVYKHCLPFRNQTLVDCRSLPYDSLHDRHIDYLKATKVSTYKFSIFQRRSHATYEITELMQCKLLITIQCHEWQTRTLITHVTPSSFQLHYRTA